MQRFEDPVDEFKGKRRSGAREVADIVDLS